MADLTQDVLSRANIPADQAGSPWISPTTADVQSRANIPAGQAGSPWVAATPPPVAATSDATRTGINDTGTAIKDGTNTNVGSTLLAGFDSSAITGDYNTVQKNLQDRQAQLKAEREQELTNINSSFELQGKDLAHGQANETGAQSASLARIGGYLGDNASGMGAAISLQNLHVQQIQGLEAKRQAALLAAQQAYNEQDFKLADQLVQESKQYHSQMLDAQKQYADQQVQQAGLEKDKVVAQQKKQEIQQAAQDFALKYSIPEDKPFYSLGGTVYNTADRTPAKPGSYNNADVFVLTGNKAAERDMVAAMQKEYPDAGITPDDTIAQASAKLQNSKIYQNKATGKYQPAKDALGNPLSFNSVSGKYYDLNGQEAKPVTTPQGTGLLDESSVHEYLRDKSPSSVAAFNGMSDLDKSDVMQLTNGDVLLSDLMTSRGVAGSAARQQLLMKARAVDPTFSETVNKQRYAFKTKWNDENGKAYNTRTAINTGLGHLATLKSLTNQLSGNSNFQKANSIQQFINDNINGPNAAIVAQFRDTVSLLAEEIAKAYKGGVPDKDEVQRQLDSLNPIRPSEITSAVIDNKVNLMTSLLQAQGSEFKNVMGQYPDQMLHREVLDEMQNAGINTQGVTKTLIQQGMHASSLHDYVAAFPDKEDAATKILRENPKLTDDDVLQILQPSFSTVGADTNAGSQGKSTAVENHTMAYTSAGPLASHTPKQVGLINGYDINSYATDPKHEKAVRSIYQNIPPMTTYSATGIDQYIQSKARGSPVRGQDVIDAAKQYGVDPNLVIALMQQDSSFGTKGKAVSTKNPGNVGNTDSGATSKHSSWRDGVFAVAKNLSKRKVSNLQQAA